MDKNALKPLATFVFFASIILIVFFSTPIPSPNAWLCWAYPLTAGLMILAILAIGYSLNGRPEGLIIDNRNRMSLSKLQMLMWTVVVVSALVVIAAYNIRLGVPQPLEIVIPPELLTAMGIAATSLVATPMILSLKSQETPAPSDVADATNAAGQSGLQNSGKVHGRGDASDAKWSDIFRGDEVGNSDSPDLSKIQQFAITLLLLVVYSAELITLMAGQTGKPPMIPGLPVLGERFIWLMGISHASYLVYKAAPHTASAPAAPQAAPAATPVSSAPPVTPPTPTSATP